MCAVSERSAQTFAVHATTNRSGGGGSGGGGGGMLVGVHYYSRIFNTP